MKELLQKWLHRKVHIYLNGLTISVVVMDIKERWGHIRYLVSPEAGKGEIWIERILEVE